MKGVSVSLYMPYEISQHADEYGLLSDTVKRYEEVIYQYYYIFESHVMLTICIMSGEYCALFPGSVVEYCCHLKIYTWFHSIARAVRSWFPTAAARVRAQVR
jgi:hypothetical protein